MTLPRERQGWVGGFVAAMHLVAAGLAAWVWLDKGFTTMIDGALRIAAIDANLAWLAVVAVVNTVISLYYYLRVIAPTVLQPPPADAPGRPAPTPPLGVSLLVTSVLTVAIGVGAGPVLELARASTAIVGG